MSHWLVAILKSSGTQAILDENARPGSALYALGSAFGAHPFFSIKGRPHLKLYSFSAYFLPVEVQGSKDCLSFVLSLSLSVQADNISTNLIILQRERKEAGRKGETL